MSKVFIYLGVLVLTAIVAWSAIDFFSHAESGGKVIKVDLGRGAFPVLEFPSLKSDTSATVLFASGDGGWSGLEEDISIALQKSGYEVIGIDSKAYAQSDYDLDLLQSDFSRIAQFAQSKYGRKSLPLIIGGYSMGAAQAIAVAGGPHPPAGLVGLLLIDPLERGRYGLRTSDELNVLPTGPGTFAMADFSPGMGSLRIVQWHAGQDTFDSQNWLATLTAPHREYNFSQAGHTYETDRPEFLRQLMESVKWILSPGEPSPIATKTAGGGQ